MGTVAKPKVSVCVVTYNQEKYIRECLQSILNQVTDFGFEVIVGDDYSTDSTREIILEISNKYPEIVFPVFHEKNIGASSNYKSIHLLARGEYVSHVDGDDLMCPGKLQKAAIFLDLNIDCAAVVHQLTVLSNEIVVGITKHNPSKIDMRYLLLNHPCFLNSSIMYRSNLGGEFLYCQDDFIDFYVYVALASRGFIGCINESLGSYRRGVGLSSSRKLMPKIQYAIDFAAKKFDNKEVISRSRARQYRSYAIASLVAGDYEGFNDYLRAMKSAHICFSNNISATMLGFSPRITAFLDKVYKKISNLIIMKKTF